MKKYGRSLLAIILSFAVVFGQTPAFAVTGKTVKEISGEYVKGQAIVHYMEPSFTLDTKNTDEFGKNIEVESSLEFGKDIKEIKLFSIDYIISDKIALVSSDKYSTEELIDVLEKESNVEAASPNYIVKSSSLTNDPYVDHQWALNNDGQYGLTAGNDIAVEELWDRGNSKENVVAVIDTGIDYTHEDLKDKMWVNEYTRDLAGKYGYDFVNTDSDPMDDDGHGTHCAGVIAAQSGNGKGISGVAKNTKVMALKFLDSDGAGSLYNAIAAYNYIYRAQTLGVNVVAINNSWGADFEEANIFKEVIDKVGEKGAVSFCASGNDRKDNDEATYFPANTDSKYCIAVGASDGDGNVAYYSNYGKNNVDLIAPGSSILSTVSYASFNPSIYSNDKITELCKYYNAFDDTSESTSYKLLDADETVGEEKIEIDKTNFAGAKDTGSALKFSIDNAVEGEIYSLCFEYESDAIINDNNKTYTSFMYSSNTINSATVRLKEVASFEKDDYRDVLSISMDEYGKSEWYHIAYESKGNIKSGAKKYLVLTIEAEEDGNFEVYIDDIAVSKTVAKKNAAEIFGKYDFSTGTSMATPYAVGAYAGLAGVLSNDLKVDEKIATFYSEVNATEKTKGKVKVGSLKFVDTVLKKPYVSSVNISGANLAITGYYFGLSMGKVTINEEVITSSRIKWTDNKIEISGMPVVYSKYLNIKVENANGASEDKIFVKGTYKKYNRENVMSEEGLYDGTFVSNGRDLFFIEEDGSISIAASEDGEIIVYSIASFETFAIDNAKSLKDKSVGYYFETVSNAVYSNGKIWTLALLTTGYSSEYLFMNYDTNTKKMGMGNGMPTDKLALNVGFSSLAAYNDDIYLFGGYDSREDKMSKIVRKYNVASKSWSVEQDLPEGRMFSTARQWQDKLVIAFGENDAGTLPKTLVYDGKTWQEKPTDIVPYTKGFRFVISEEKTDYYTEDMYTGNIRYFKKIEYYRAHSGVAKEGIVFAGITCENLGDTFVYNPNTNTYTKSSYSLGNNIDTKLILAESVDKKFYVAYSVYTMEDSELFSESEELYSIPISSVNYTVKGTKSKKGTISGIGSYLPNDTATIKVKAAKKYYVKSIKVGSKKVKNGYSFRVNKNTKVTVKYGRAIDKITLNKTKAKVKKGAKLKLKAKLKPKKPDSKALVWKSSNKKIATVNKKGVVTVKKNAKKGKKVTITCKAKAHSKAKTKCVITVK